MPEPSPQPVIRTILVEGIVYNLRALLPRIDEIAEEDVLKAVAGMIVDAITPRSLELLRDRQNAAFSTDYRRVQDASTDPESREVFGPLRDQLLIVLINRDGGSVKIPVEEVDQTGEFILRMRTEDRSFVFTVDQRN